MDRSSSQLNKAHCSFDDIERGVILTIHLQVILLGITFHIMALGHQRGLVQTLEIIHDESMLACSQQDALPLMRL